MLSELEKKTPPTKLGIFLDVPVDWQFPLFFFFPGSLTLPSDMASLVRTSSVHDETQSSGSSAAAAQERSPQEVFLYLIR